MGACWDCQNQRPQGGSWKRRTGTEVALQQNSGTTWREWGALHLEGTPDRRHSSAPCKRPRIGYQQVAPTGVQDVDLVVRGLCVFLNAAANITREEIRLTTVCQALRQHYIDSGLRTIVENAKLQAQDVNRAMVRPDWEWQIALRRVPPIKSDNLTSAYHQLYHQRIISAPQVWCRMHLPGYRVHWIMVDKKVYQQRAERIPARG